MAVEVADSKVIWCEPHDIHLREVINELPGQRLRSKFSTQPHGVSLIEEIERFADSKPTADRFEVRYGVTQPFYVPWLDGYPDSILNSLPSQPMNLNETEYVAHPLLLPKQKENNVVWTAALQLGWKRTAGLSQVVVCAESAG